MKVDGSRDLKIRIVRDGAPIDGGIPPPVFVAK
jgi:hypothetical protein